jgi:hypothetical protein
LRREQRDRIVRAGVGGGGARFLDEVVDDQRGPLRIERVEPEGGDAFVLCCVVLGRKIGKRQVLLLVDRSMYRLVN